MRNPLVKLMSSILFVAISMLTGMFLSPEMLSSQTSNVADPIDNMENSALQAAQSPTPSATILSTGTPTQSVAALPTNTLKPPPTFEPPTQTPTATLPPTETVITAVDVAISIPGLNGAQTPTPSATPGCVPRSDWKLIYTVQPNDALDRIAGMYNTTSDELAVGNCVRDKNMIVIGQQLRVPGAVHPDFPDIECRSFEVLTPADRSATVPADGNVTFNWRGPLAPRYLLRIQRPDGSTFDRIIELRQNETINVSEHLQQAGTYSWSVHPLNHDNQVLPCGTGGPWTFYKAASGS